MSKNGVAFALAAAGMIFATGVQAASMDALQGAWTTGGTDCADTFHKVDGKIAFKDKTSSLTTGILINGNKITGSNMSCTAGKISEMKDHLSVLLSCADSVMFQSMSMSFRVVDKDTFERMDPSFPEISMRYYRCQL